MTARDCAAIRNQLAEYLCGEVEAAAGARIRAHLKSCAGCRQELAALAPLIQDLNRLARTLPSPPPELAARALARAKADGKAFQVRAESWRLLLRPVALTGVAAAVALALVLARHPAPGQNPVTPVRSPVQSEARLPVEQQPRVMADAGGTKIRYGARQPVPPQAQDRVGGTAPKAAEQPWVEVFAGAREESGRVVSRLAAEGIRTREEPAGAGRVKVMVPPGDAGRSRRLLNAPANAQD
ncbi:MAG: zf-HC2 domain-containing protein [Methanocella sp.]